MDDQEAITQYRNFRQQLLNAIAKDRDRTNRGWYLTKPSQREFAAGRRTITAFRQAVAEQAKTLLQTSPESEMLVRRALRISQSVPLQQPGALAIAGQIVLFCLPMRLAVHHARHLLEYTGTFEGRKFLFERYIKLSLSGGRERYYGDSLDFALRRFDEIRSQQDIDALACRDVDMLKVAHRLGLRTPTEVCEALPFNGRRLKSRLLWLLVSEDVILTAAELLWADESSSNWADDESIPVLRDTVRCLLDYGVGRKQVAGILRFPLWTLNLGTLTDNLSFLESVRGIDLSDTLEQLGDRLWRTPMDTWRFVVKTIGAHSAPEIARFKRLLDCNHRLSEELVHELVSLGATQDDLADCQRLLMEAKPEAEGASLFIDNLRQLTALPYALSVSQLSHCSAYVRGGSDLAPFLQVLISHGWCTAQMILEFQCCFHKVSVTSLDRILTILGTRGKDEPLARVATWVLDAGKGGYFDAYDYLISACKMEDILSLQQALKLVPLGTPFLRYLVEARGLSSLKEIRAWYYNARGIEGYQSWNAYDALDRVLLDDAFTRNQFNHMAGNQDVVRTVVRHHVERQLGAWPCQEDESAKNIYQHAREALVPTIRDELLPFIPTILNSTGGILLPTLFEEDSDGIWRLEHKLARLGPLLVELMNGCGPSGGTLTSQEVDAIALIYRTPADKVVSRWSQVQGRESDIQRFRLRSHYPMVWHQVRWQLQGELDSSGFDSLLKAARFAQRFRNDTYRDMLTACQHLCSRKLRPDFHPLDVSSMALHLGSLLAVAQDHEGVGHWVRDGFEALARMDKHSLNAYQRMSDLIDFFNVLLPDALDAHFEGYVTRLSQKDASHWATRLGPCPAVESGHAQLRTMLRQTRAKALPIYLDWAKRQHKRYKKEGNTSLKSQHLVALASKHPAAFFAKSAVQLCTADNVKMWEEERLFHLLVFDLTGRRLAGMALIYVQDLPELDCARRSLVIRAINPTDEMLAGHSVASIVESFLDVAVQIADDNDLGCVAFPSLTGMHLMSNRAPIEAYLKERYVKRAFRWRGLGNDSECNSLREKPQQVETTFYAYEHGQELVENLYVIWRTAEASRETQC